MARRALSMLNGPQQPFARELAVLALRAGILHRHGDSARPMPQCNRRGDFVYILSAGATRAREKFLKIALTNAELRHALVDLLSHDYSQLNRREVLAAITQHARHPNQLVQEFIQPADQVLIEQVALLVE